jgi:MOSC domain-containing protein YiiM
MTTTPLRWFAGSVQPLPESGRPSAMFKQSLSSPPVLDTNGLRGDQQADRSVHGGPEKAVHVYPREHLAALAQAFPALAEALQAGVLGENLSIAGLTEDMVRVGECWRLGDVALQVCQPRQPCWKIDDRLQTEGVTAHIDAHGLTGWYCRVLQGGQVAADAVLQREEGAGPTLAQARALSRQHRPSPAELQALAQTEGIAREWASKLRKRAEYLARLQSA